MNFKDGVLMTLSVGKWGGGKSLTPDDLGLTPSQVPEFMTLGRKMLIPKDEKSVFVQIENNARNALERESFAFPVGGARFVPRNRLFSVDERLKEYQNEYQGAIDSFLDRYSEIRDRMLDTYPEHRDKLEPFYPPIHQIRRLFYFSWQVFEIGEVGGIREGETVEAYQRFRDNLQRQFDTFLNEAVLDMRFQVQECCRHVSERISRGEIVNGNSMKSLGAMIDKFTALNFVGDKKIEEQLAGLREKINTIDPKELKENEVLRKELGEMAGRIAQEAADISDVSEITGTYKRQIDMD